MRGGRRFDLDPNQSFYRAVAGRMHPSSRLMQINAPGKPP
jgi:hypothetical protein